MSRPLPKVADKCPICDALWSGGCQVPGQPYPKVGLRVFYRCGCSISVKQDLEADRAEEAGVPDTLHDYIAYLMLVKNCGGKQHDGEPERPDATH